MHKEKRMMCRTPCTVAHPAPEKGGSAMDDVEVDVRCVSIDRAYLKERMSDHEQAWN
jgi:hypothetical protein